MRFQWKDATLASDVKAQQTTLRQMHEHTAKLIETLLIDKSALEAEGLGLRPVTAASGLSTIDKEILARRYCRLAEWTEACQGGDWVAVSCSPAWYLPHSSQTGPRIRGVSVLLAVVQARPCVVQRLVLVESSCDEHI